MQLKKAADLLPAPVNSGRPLGMLERSRASWVHFASRHQAFSQVLQLEQARAAVALAGIDRRNQVRDFFRQAPIARVDLAADLEQTERCQMPAVLENVLSNSGQQAGPHQSL